MLSLFFISAYKILLLCSIPVESKLFDQFLLDILREEILIFKDKFTYLEVFDIRRDFDLVGMER